MKQTILFFTLIAAALLSACDKNDDSNGSITGYWYAHAPYGEDNDNDALMYFSKHGTLWGAEIDKEKVPLTARMERAGAYQQNGNDYISTFTQTDWIPDGNGYAVVEWSIGVTFTLNGDKLTVQPYKLPSREEVKVLSHYDTGTGKEVSATAGELVSQAVYDEIIEVYNDGGRRDGLAGVVFERYPDAEKLYTFKYAPADEDDDWQDERPSDY